MLMLLWIVLSIIRFGFMKEIADKGYESRRDIENCLMTGIIPNVAF